MAEFLIGVLVAGFLVGEGSRGGSGVAARLRTYLNRKRYDRLVTKARARGFEREFQEQWRIYSDCIPFGMQTGYESMHAFRRAEAISKQRTD